MVCAEYHREGPLGANESITHAEVAHLRPREHSALTDKLFFSELKDMHLSQCKCPFLTYGIPQAQPIGNAEWVDWVHFNQHPS